MKNAGHDDAVVKMPLFHHRYYQEDWRVSTQVYLYRRLIMILSRRMLRKIRKMMIVIVILEKSR